MYPYPEVGSVVESLGGASVLRTAVRSVAELAKRVREGLPVKSLYFLSARFPTSQRRYIEQLVAARTTLQRRGISGVLSTDESERLERLARVSALAEHVWESRAQAQAWLSAPLALLEGLPPLEHAASELGARRVEDILWKLEFSMPV